MIILLIIFSIGLLLIIRNHKTDAFINLYENAAFSVVIDFLESLHNDQELHDRKVEYEELYRMLHQIIDKHFYAKILFSFKPFKLEAWFTPEEVEFIKRGLK